MLAARFIIATLVPLGFGFLFLAAGISKFLRASSIVHTVSNFRLLPPLGARVVAGLLAPLESAAGILLLLSLWFPIYRFASALTAGLLLVFSLAVASALLRGLKFPCGCGLLLNGHVISWLTLGRNLLMLAVLALDFLMRRGGIFALGTV